MVVWCSLRQFGIFTDPEYSLSEGSWEGSERKMDWSKSKTFSSILLSETFLHKVWCGTTLVIYSEIGIYYLASYK